MTRTLKSTKKAAKKAGKKLAPEKGKSKKRLPGLERPPAITLKNEDTTDVLLDGLPSPEYLRSKKIPLLTAVSWAVQEYINLRDPYKKAQFKADAEAILITQLTKMAKSGDNATRIKAVEAFVSMQEMDKVNERGLMYAYGKALDTFGTTSVADLQAEVIRADKGETEQSMAAIFGEIFTKLQQGRSLESIADEARVIEPAK